MTSFHEFSTGRIASGGFSTEDSLASFLPLAREVLDAHAAGLVAPLEGIGELQVDGVRVWFAEARRQPLRRQAAAVKKVTAADVAQFDVSGRWQRATDVDTAESDVKNLKIGQRGEPIQRPVFLPGYVAWEHELEHHDPLTDVYILGLILASLACGLDLTESTDLETFVAHRGNLFQIRPGLHPVLARAIVRMTEIDPHRRVQDLAAVVRNLENYRDQEVDFDIDLASSDGFQQQDRRGKQFVVLKKLRERLFEISRRNRMLHFRPNMQTVNLTEASIPLSFDIQNIRPDQILIWNESLANTVAAGKPFSLNQYLNFREALYLPHVLNKTITEARRDQAEFGFVQLRLVACFLDWANFKEEPIEQYRSPLVLLPVKLTKKKGIRDTYQLQALTGEAEINPVVRHMFKQLYDIDLPRQIDLSQWTLSDFYDHLAAKIGQRQSAVTLEKIDRPRIEVIHEKARRTLDQYRRRARVSGRGVRTFLDLDYSYDPANYHPLGIKLFSAKIRPPSTRLREIIEENPRPRTFAAPHDSPTTEKERTVFTLKKGDENPYTWHFDLCSVTLSNFKYRKMSLVRDYDVLVDEQPDNPAFDATFSLVPRPTGQEANGSPPLTDRYDVVPCDPTQAAAIASAQRDQSYIIQGPPGTGKSQTITNLIADYVARGQRVLFVCEKRAAIDVVYARLRQAGLGDLCCLIHDSQADKKQFVMHLKKTYESFLSNISAGSEDDVARDDILQRLQRDLEPLQDFDEAMRREPAAAGTSVRELVTRCIELHDELLQLSPLDRERLPDYATWCRHRPAVDKFTIALKEIQRDLIFANHPLARLSPRLAHVDRPLELVTSTIQAVQQALERIEKTLASTGISRSNWDTLATARQLIDYANSIAPLANRGHLPLLGETERAEAFTAEVAKFAAQREIVEQAREENCHWKHKLPASEVRAALPLARQFEGSTFAWLKPSWWRLRKAMKRAYDFRAHVIRRNWVQVLTGLEHEYDLLDAWDKHRKDLAERFNIPGEVDELIDRVAGLRTEIAALPEWLASIHREFVASSQVRAAVGKVVAAEPALESLVAHLGEIIDDFDNGTIDELRAEMASMESNLDDLPDFLHCTTHLATVAAPLATALRSLPLTPRQLEAAAADATLETIYREDRTLDRFTGSVRDHHAGRLGDGYDRWLKSNAAEIHERVKQRFAEHMRIANLPSAQLSDDEKEFKKRYNRGRRELEHEFGKQMRYKPIRDLVAEESGEVVKDLKPVWLMSPLSVSDTLPLDTDHVDVVIFDEASQITLEEAVPSIFRAAQAIVVGDQMQLPPTDFFSAKRREDEEELLIEEDGELVQYDLESNSFLNHAAKNLPSTMLGWHYRSRSESLISFSNWAFYDGGLLTVPEESLPGPNQRPLTASSPADAATNADELVTRPVSFHFMEHGVYDRRRNRAEADYIAQMVRRLLTNHSGLSIGVVAFSEAQQEEIDGALERLAQQDAAFRDRLDAELEREEDGQFVGLLIKNLENMQGDERDVIILSVCYGHGPNRKMRMNFGPINRSGGEKRLNVAFTRAKHHMAIVSSIRSEAITNDYNDGANCLKNYLRYAESMSAGKREQADLVLRSMSRWYGTDETRHDAPTTPLAQQIAATLTKLSHQVDAQVGQSHFRCDLAVRRPGETEYRLGILLDGDAYYEQTDLLERDVMRPKLLEAFGWQVTHVLSKDWHGDRQSVVDRITQILKTDSPTD